MLFKFFLLNSFLSTSFLFASDHLSRKQQNDEMERAFYQSKRLETLQDDEISDTEKNEEDTIFVEQSEILKQCFPGASDIVLDQNRVLQQAQKNIPSSTPIMTIEDFQHIQKVASQTIFHQINDALNYLLTGKSIIKSSLSKNPNLIHFTLFDLMGNNEDGIYAAYYPLQSINHPVADLAQSYLILKEFQYWIDVIYLMKKTIFSTDSFDSYNHNKAVAMKEILQKKGAQLCHKVEKQLELRSKFFHPSTRSDNKISLFMNAQENFYFALQNLMYNVVKILPNSTVSFVPLRQGRTLKKVSNPYGKNIRERVIHTLSGDMDELDAYFSENLTEIFSIIRSHAMVESLERLSPDNQNAVMSSVCFNDAIRTTQETPASYELLFQGMTNNIKNLQKTRKRIGLPPEIFDGDDIGKQMLNALKHYRELHIKIIEQDDTEPSKAPQEPDHNYDKGPVSDMQKNSSIEEQEDTVENQNDPIIYDTNYFKRMHDYHQKLKQSRNKSSKQHQQGTFSAFELELYEFMNEMIYHPVHRPTWSGLITDLDYFGFKGEPNRSGNGSTWVFSVTDRNELFYNEGYRQATFNVHEFKGNEPIHPKYLKFFQSGFSNVFGLTEEYITAALKKHAAQTKKN